MIRGFIDRLLGRKRYVMPTGNGKAHDDWQAGDLALCNLSEGGAWFALENGEFTGGPKSDEVLQVVAVDMAAGWHVLSFASLPGEWWTAENFLKIRPDAKEACTEGFRIRMRDLGRKVDA